MIEILSSTFIDTRTGLKMFQLTMKKDGTIASTRTPYNKLVNKSIAESEFCSMINKLCELVYNVKEEKTNLFKR
jgi:hypothetical protein